MRAAATSLALLLTLAASGLRGEDFRVDTELFIDNAKAPAVETQTIFAGGMIYDFLLTKPEEITVFDPDHGTLTLLNVQRQTKARLSTQELLEGAVALQTAALTGDKPVFVAAAKPGYQPKVTPLKQNGHNFTRLLFESPTIQYDVTAQAPKGPDAAKQYKYFSDWYARLNSVRHRAGNLPAGARLEVNDAIAKQGLLPIRIERVVHASGKTHVVRTEHLLNWELNQGDRDRLEKARQYQAQFTLVTFEAYCAPK